MDSSIRGRQLFQRCVRGARVFAWLAPVLAVIPVMAQDDVTTQSGSSGYNGAFITGPASNPLSFLNGPAYRTFGQTTPYDFPDFAPMRELDQQLPRWIQFGWEERFRYEGYHDGSFKPHKIGRASCRERV